LSLLIRKGEIVTADSRFHADIFVQGETITRIGQNLEAPADAQVIDASGKYVFPGFIDPHVHIYLPFMSTFAKDTHETGSIAALVGGSTTFIEMVCPSRTDDALQGYQLWKSKAEGNSGLIPITFKVMLDKASSKTVSVHFATSNGTAIAGSDYNGASGTVTFAAGQTLKMVTVFVKGDKVKEANETLDLDL